MSKIPPESFIKKHIKKIIIFVSIIIALLALIAGVFTYQGNLPFVLPFSSSKTPADDTNLLLEEVGALIVLPQGEQPTIATVSDKTKLAGQSFFKNAENGDRVIIYQKSGKAILYRPSLKKIIDVASLANTAQLDSGNSSPSAVMEEVKDEKKYRLVLYNATKISGLARTKEAALEKNLPNTEVVQRGNATGDYDKTLVIDLKGTEGEFAKTLAKELNAEVSELPNGETEPKEADFLIILAE